MKTKVQDVEISQHSLITANTEKCAKYARGLVITVVSKFLPFQNCRHLLQGQRGRRVRAPKLKSRSRGFMFRSVYLAGVVSR